MSKNIHVFTISTVDLDILAQGQAKSIKANRERPYVKGFRAILERVYIVFHAWGISVAYGELYQNFTTSRLAHLRNYKSFALTQCL